MICYMTEERVQLMRDRMAAADRLRQQLDEGSGRWAELAKLRELSVARIVQGEKLVALADKIEVRKRVLERLTTDYVQQDV